MRFLSHPNSVRYIFLFLFCSCFLRKMQEKRGTGAHSTCKILWLITWKWSITHSPTGNFQSVSGKFKALSCFIKSKKFRQLIAAWKQPNKSLQDFYRIIWVPPFDTLVKLPVLTHLLTEVFHSSFLLNVALVNDTLWKKLYSWHKNAKCRWQGSHNIPSKSLCDRKRQCCGRRTALFQSSHYFS